MKKNLWVIAMMLTIMLVVTGCGQEKEKGKTSEVPPATAPVTNVPSVWVINNDLMDAAVYRIDPASNKEIAKIPFEGSPGGIAVTPEAVWVTDFANDKVVRIDPATNKIKASVNTGKGPRVVVTSPGSVWVANSVEGTITRVDVASNSVVATINVTNSSLNGLCFMDNALWVSGADFTVYKIDTQTNQVTTKVNVGTLPGGITGKSGTLWAVAPVGGELLRIDLTDNKVATVLTTNHAIAVAMLQNTIAVANSGEGIVSLVNTVDNNAKEDIKVGNNLGAIAPGYGSFWVTSTDDNALYRIDLASKKVVATISIKRVAKVATGMDDK